MFCMGSYKFLLSKKGLPNIMRWCSYIGKESCDRYLLLFHQSWWTNVLANGFQRTYKTDHLCTKANKKALLTIDPASWKAIVEKQGHVLNFHGAINCHIWRIKKTVLIFVVLYHWFMVVF